ncbi:hypothetical protein AB1N83_013366 [Pleurotus pulmonarius]
MSGTQQAALSGPTLADLLTIDSGASMFYSYAREVEVSRIFTDAEARTTVLVPTNKAIVAMPKKPHQSISDDATTSEEGSDSRSNVEKWVSAHIIPESPIVLAPKTYPTLLPGKNVSFTDVSDEREEEWRRVLLEGKVRITATRVASNGVLYFIDGTVSVD